MSTIPASLFSSVSPSVLAASGQAVDVIGLVLTTNPRVPTGTTMSFPDAQSVGSFFGLGSDEYAKAVIYFAGFEIADATPGAMLFAQYNEVDVAAYLRGGNAGAALTLAQLQAMSGSLTAVVDGYSHVIASISFAADASFSAAAAAIQAAFTDPTESTFTGALGASFTATGTGTQFVVTSVTGIISVGDVVTGTGAPGGTTIAAFVSGTPGGAGTYTTNQATTCASASCTTASTVLNVTVETGDDIQIGQTLAGAGIAGSPIITALITGTGGEGTYRISGTAQHIASEAMTGVATAPTVTYDSTSGAFVITSGIAGTHSTSAFATGTLAVPLLLTSATGATLSQGADAAVPGTFMDALVAYNDNWVTFMTLFDPDDEGENTVKQAFAAWKNTKDDRFAYVCWDTDVSPTVTVPATGSLGYILTNNEDSGTCLIWAPDASTGAGYAAFVCGSAASIDFEEVNGRITFAFKNQAGLVATVSTSAVAVNLGGNPQVEGSRGNGYNYYGAVGAANTNFLWFQRGFVTGGFAWLDSYVNQVALNSALQVAGLTLQNNSKSIPYTVAGGDLIETAYADPIDRFLTFGAFGPGTISASQANAVNTAAGAQVADSLQTAGYYLQVLAASSGQRASRTSPPAKLWYLDRGSVQSLSLQSIALS